MFSQYTAVDIAVIDDAALAQVGGGADVNTH